MPDTAYQHCRPCLDYYRARRPVLAPALADRLLEAGETPAQILDRYMSGVHDRHLAGLPLLKAEAPRDDADLRITAGRFAALMAMVGPDPAAGD